ncbi:MAG: hypothetical protein ACYC2K_04200 [Gemmatimonadales bacterium]
MMTSAHPVRAMARDVVRSRWLVGLGLFLALAGDLLLRFGEGAAARASLMDIVLVATPLAGLVIGTIQVHNAREITELLLAQPVTRTRLFFRLFLSTVAPLSLVLSLGVVLPFTWHSRITAAELPHLAALVAGTLLLTAISTALAFIIALRADDRVRALGIACLIWLAAAVLWDGLILLLSLMYADRPIEWPVVALLVLNPLDLVRVLLLLGTDGAALFGYTGAVLQHTLGTGLGRAMLVAVLLLWLALPLGAAARTFTSKDF